MVYLRRISVNPPLINTSCAWASELDQLEELYQSPFTGAVTTRTATLTGFHEDESHTVAFAKDSISSINSYGYSPHPLSVYLGWIRTIIKRDVDSTKPFIISITSSSPISLSSMIEAIQEVRAELNDTDGSTSRIAVELNTSCPNIKGSPPPSYHFPSLLPLLDVLAQHFWKDTTLTIGLKLPPYVYSTQFDDVLNGISSFSLVDDVSQKPMNPFAFFTCTNTLGSSLLFAEQAVPGDTVAAPNVSRFAVPTGLGGLAGESIHAISLGNIHTFTKSLAVSPDVALRDIAVIGVGGVTSTAAAQRMRQAGAAVVGCATLLGRKGVAAFEELSQSTKD